MNYFSRTRRESIKTQSLWAFDHKYTATIITIIIRKPWDTFQRNTFKLAEHHSEHDGSQDLLSIFSCPFPPAAPARLRWVPVPMQGSTLNIQSVCSDQQSHHSLCCYAASVWEQSFSQTDHCVRCRDCCIAVGGAWILLAGFNCAPVSWKGLMGNQKIPFSNKKEKNCLMILMFNDGGPNHFFLLFSCYN